MPILLLLISAQSLEAAVPVSSGTTQLGNTLTYGKTSYSVDYSHPAAADVGTNLTIALTLNVDSLGGQIEYIEGYRINVYLYIGAQIVGNGSAVSPLNAPYLYPGGTWGPNNVTIPLTASGTGLGKGQSANATVSFILEDQVFVVNGRLLSYTNEPPMQGQAGSLIIDYPATSTTSSTSSTIGAGGQTHLPEVLLLLASGAVMMALAVALWPRQPKGGDGRARAL